MTLQKRIKEAVTVVLTEEKLAKRIEEAIWAVLIEDDYGLRVENIRKATHLAAKKVMPS